MRNAKLVWIVLIFCFGCSEKSRENANESAGNGNNNRIAEFCDQGYCVERISEFDKDFYLSPADLNSKATDDDGNIASTNTLLVKFKDDASISEIKKVLDEIEGKVSAFIPDVNIFELRFDCDFIGQIEGNIQTLLTSGIVEYAEKNYAIELEDLDIENSELAGASVWNGIWGFEEIKLVEARDFIEKENILLHSIKIAVLDSGINLEHKEFSGLNVEQYDLADNDLDISANENGHGTAVAGIIFANNENGGINGIAFGNNLLAYKLLSDGNNENYHYERTLIASIRHAVSQGASVINISAKTKTFSNLLVLGLLKFAVQDAYDKGVIIVSSTGNGDGELDCINTSDTFLWPAYCLIGDDATNHFPSTFPEVISVGSTNRLGLRSEFSNYSQNDDPNVLTLAAPGEDVIVLTGQNGYSLVSGTSFASPMVAGLAGLLLQIKPDASPDRIRQVMYNSGVEIYAKYPDGTFHIWRRINALEAVKMITSDMHLPRQYIGRPCVENSDCDFNLFCNFGVCTETCFEEQSRGLDIGYTCSNCNLFCVCPIGTSCVKARSVYGLSIGRQTARFCLLSCQSDNDCFNEQFCWSGSNGMNGFCMHNFYKDLYLYGNQIGYECGNIFDGYRPIACQSGFCDLEMDFLGIGHCR